MTLEQMILKLVKSGWDVTFRQEYFGPARLPDSTEPPCLTIRVTKSEVHARAQPLEVESFPKIVSGFEKWAEKHIGEPNGDIGTALCGIEGTSESQ